MPTYNSPAVRSAIRLYPEAYVTDKGIVRDQPYKDLPEVVVSFVGEIDTTLIAPTITTTTLANGKVGTAYTATVSATGDSVVFSLKAGSSLPAGLSLAGSGAITGTPSAAATTTFTVVGTNGAGTNEKQLSITVAP